jgi:pSer/pThr/pTyr-binding forkhead associated (FHA) protein
MPTCPECGAELEPGATMCRACGAQAAGTAAMPPVAAKSETFAAEASPAAEPSLVVVKGPDTGERFVLDRREVMIGRDPDATIFLNDITVSRRHALVVVEESGVTVEDLGSLNGTYVNGETVEKAILADGDHIQIGRFLLVFFWGVGG